ncbi:MAG: hypothetical protein LBS72_02245 [Oscillospiraceae bacterium]|nr:hypothetical protein [Oscillospiraceae bacterium]
MQPTKHGFIGAYTRDGYVMFDPRAMIGEDLVRRITICGGSRSARGECLRAIARRISERGYEADMMHSTLDHNILQCIVCPGCGLFVISDDTADSEYESAMDGGYGAQLHSIRGGGAEPGAKVSGEEYDTVIDLDEALRTVRSGAFPEAMDALLEEAAAYERRAARCLEAAVPMRRDAEEEYRSALNEKAMERLLAPWIDTITAFRSSADGGVEARFFAEAVTPGGLVQYLDTIAMPRLWRISGPWGCDFHTPLSKLRDAALSRGMRVLCSMEALRPDRICHLLINELELFITSEECVGALADSAQRTIDIRQVMPGAEKMSQNTMRALAFDELTYDQLLERAAHNLELAHKIYTHIDKKIEERMDGQAFGLLTGVALEAAEAAFARRPVTV